MAEEQDKITRTKNRLTEYIPTWLIVVALIIGFFLIPIITFILSYKDLSEGISEIRRDLFPPIVKDTTSISDTKPAEGVQPGGPRGYKKKTSTFDKTIPDTLNDKMQDEDKKSFETQEIGIPQTFEINRIMAKLIECSRNGSRVKVVIQVSNSYDGNIKICTKDGPWSSEMIGENTKKYFAKKVRSGDEESQRCIEVTYIKDLAVQFWMEFENVDVDLKRIMKLKISTSFGDLVFTKFNITS